VDEMSAILLKGGSNGRLMVVLPYSAERVARMKTIPGRRWHPEEKCWSVPHADGMVERLLALFTGEQVEVNPSLRPVSAPAHRKLPLASGSTPVVMPEPSLFDRVRQALQSRHYSHRTEQADVAWIERFICFHGKRHPVEMGEGEINQFLTDLAVKQKVSASTQNQALSALLFLYRHVLKREIGNLGAVIRARKPQRLPVVMTRDEVKAVLGHLTGDKWLMTSLMYGAGLRLMECLRLRVKDSDFERSEITVRDGKGDKDRRTMLPAMIYTHVLNKGGHGVRSPVDDL
jgi:hypothetical protein